MKPALSMPEARVTLETAASSVGLTLQELAELALAVAPPTHQAGLLCKATLRDVGESLFGRMPGIGHPPEERAAFFESLGADQRDVLVLWLAEKGFAPSTIAHDLGVTESYVRKLWNARAEDLGREVQSISLEALAGAIQSRYEQCVELAREKGDYRSMMGLEEKRVALLQSLGVVEQAVQKHSIEVTHKIQDSMQRELDRILELRERARTREIEWKESEEVVDAEAVTR